MCAVSIRRAHTKNIISLIGLNIIDALRSRPRVVFRIARDIIIISLRQLTRLLQYRYLAVSRRRGVPYTLLLLLLLFYTAFVRHGFYIIYFYFFTLLIMCIVSRRIDTFNMYDAYLNII